MSSNYLAVNGIFSILLLKDGTYNTIAESPDGSRKRIRSTSLKEVIDQTYSFMGETRPENEVWYSGDYSNLPDDGIPVY